MAVKLPDIPGEWHIAPPATEPDASGAGGGLLSGLVSIPNATPETSSLNAFVAPKTMVDIDFSGPLDDTSHMQGDASASRDWRQLPRPGDLEAGEHGSGYYTYGTDKGRGAGTAANAQWGRPGTMEVIGAVADRLATSGQYTPFGIGNISLQGGANFSPDHKGHRDGLGIDVRPPRTDGAQSGVTYKDPAYDRAATQRLVDAFRSTGQVSTIYFNDPQIRGVLPLDGHDNHLHVQLNRWGAK